MVAEATAPAAAKKAKAPMAEASAAVTAPGAAPAQAATAASENHRSSEIAALSLLYAQGGGMDEVRAVLNSLHLGDYADEFDRLWPARRDER